MRKTIIALIAVLALVVAAPAMAAEINLGGSLETRFNFRPEEGNGALEKLGY